MYPYGQRVNSIAPQYIPYANLINRSPVYVSNQQRQHSPLINNFVPYGSLYWCWFFIWYYIMETDNFKTIIIDSKYKLNQDSNIYSFEY